MEQLQLLETKYVNLGNERIPIRLSFRAMIEYESMTGKKVQDIEGTENIVKFFYCSVKAGAKETYYKFNDTYDEFLSRVDKHPQSIVDFCAHFFDIDMSDDEIEKKK